MINDYTRDKYSNLTSTEIFRVGANRAKGIVNNALRYFELRKVCKCRFCGEWRESKIGQTHIALGTPEFLK